MKEMSGLKRIICLDAHIPGKLMEIKVSNHANLSGTNGAGKTTLLKLVPFFYGASSSQVVQKVGKRKSFVDYYLPRPTSLIIFEYNTQRGAMCSVVFRHSSGDKPAYRFLGEPFNISYFSETREGERVFVDGKSLGQHWALQHLEHSKQLESVTDYRAVIQGDRSLINQSGQSKDLTRLVSLFSITGRLGGMRYIDKMASAILGRSGDMNRIKEMLADIMREDGISLPQINLHKNVREIIAELAIIRDLEHYIDSFRSVISKGTSYIENSSHLDYLYSELQLIKKNITTQLGDVDNALLVLHSELKVLKAEWEDREMELQSKVTQSKSDLNETERNLEQLMKDKEKWEKQGIAEKTIEYSQLQNFQRLQEDAIERLSVLEEGVNDLRSNYEQRTYREKDRYNQTRQEFNESIAQLKIQLSSIISQWQEKQLELSQKNSLEKSQIIQDRQYELDRLTIQIEESRLHAINILPTEEEKIEQHQVDEARDLASSAYQVAIDDLSRAERVGSKAKEAMLDAEAIAKKATRAKEVENQEMQRILALCSPKPNSLLAALREKDPSWHDNLGRVIRPELLERKDLAPILTEDSERTLMGWSFDLHKIEKPTWASSQEEQECLLNKQEEKLDLAEQHEKACQKKFKTQVDAFQDTNKVIDECQRKKKRASQQLDSSTEAVRQIKQKNLDLANERKLAAKTRLAQLEKQKQQTQDNINKELASLAQRYESSLSEELNITTLEQNRIQDDIEQTERSIKEENANHQRTLKTLDDDFKALCSEQGLDETRLKDAEENVRSTKAKVKRVQGYREAVSDHAEWLTRRWSLRAEYTQAFEQAQLTHDQAQQTINEARQTYKIHRDEKNAQRLQQESQQRKLREESDECKSILSKLSAPVTPVKVSTIRSQTSVITECTTLLNAQIQLRNDIKKGINHAESIICKNGDGNQIAEAWEELRRQEQSKLLDPNNVEALAINLTMALEQLISVQLPQKRHALSLYVETIGGQLNDFYLGLKSVSGAIKNQSRQISSSISSTMHFDAISNIQVALISRIDSQDYWPVLGEFHSIWQEWKQDGVGELPPKGVDQQLILVTDILHRSKLNQGIESVFDLEISLRENDRPVSVTRNADLENVSSTGLSYLILCSIFAGITRMLCRDDSVYIHWPMDELGTLAAENISKLFVMLDQHNIIMVGGFPTTDPLLLQHFKEHHEVKKGEGIIELVLPEDKLSAIMAQRKQQNNNAEVQI